MPGVQDQLLPTSYYTCIRVHSVVVLLVIGVCDEAVGHDSAHALTD